MTPSDLPAKYDEVLGNPGEYGADISHGLEIYFDFSVNPDRPAIQIDMTRGDHPSLSVIVHPMPDRSEWTVDQVEEYAARLHRAWLTMK